MFENSLFNSKSQILIKTLRKNFPYQWARLKKNPLRVFEPVGIPLRELNSTGAIMNGRFAKNETEMDEDTRLRDIKSKISSLKAV